VLYGFLGRYCCGAQPGRYQSATSFNPFCDAKAKYTLLGPTKDWNRGLLNPCQTPTPGVTLPERNNYTVFEYSNQQRVVAQHVQEATLYWGDTCTEGSCTCACTLHSRVTVKVSSMSSLPYISEGKMDCIEALRTKSRHASSPVFDATFDVSSCQESSLPLPLVFTSS
jgi:hypothetical protein